MQQHGGSGHKNSNNNFMPSIKKIDAVVECCTVVNTRLMYAEEYYNNLRVCNKYFKTPSLHSRNTDKRSTISPTFQPTTTITIMVIIKVTHFHIVEYLEQKCSKGLSLHLPIDMIF